MTTYRTGNPIGSTDPRDLYDNAENLDELVNSQDKAEHPDRLGVPRKTWHGIEEDFQSFLQSSGYQDLGDYAPGIEVTARNQYVRADGELWRIAASVDLPYTTSGDWAADSGSFVAMGDAALRQELADPAQGGALVRVSTSSGEQTLAEALDARAVRSRLSINVMDFGAIGDGIADDTPAIQSAIDAAGGNKGVVYFPAGVYNFSEVIINENQDVSLTGEGRGSVLRGVVHLHGASVSTAGSVHRSDISYLRFYGQSQEGSVGIELEYTWQTRIHNCFFENMLKGVSIVTSSIRDHIEDNYFIEVSYPLYQEDDSRSADISFTRNQVTPNAIKSICLHRMDGLNITDNVFFASPGTGLNENHIYISNRAGTDVHNSNWIRIANNTFFETGNPIQENPDTSGALVIDGADNITSQIIITGNIFGWCFQPIRLNATGVNPAVPRGGVIISDNYIDQRQDKRGECHSIYVGEISKTLDIHNNSIYKTGGNAANTYDAIRVVNCGFPRVTNNHILNEGSTTHRHGIAFDDCSNPIAAMNSIIGSGSAPVDGGPSQANTTTFPIAKFAGIAWAQCALQMVDGSAQYFPGRHNITVTRTGTGLFSVEYDRPSPNAACPMVMTSTGSPRLIGSPSTLGFGFEVVSPGGTRVDPERISVIAL